VADVDELCGAVRTLLDSSEVRNRIGKKAREKVLREYDMARNTERFATLIEKQLNPSAR
jgi:glycosyltransferase involved in cell wall biosynthesis